MATSYTLTITSSDASGPSVTINIDLDSGGLRVTDLSIRAGQDGSTFPRQLAALNLRPLLNSIADLPGAVADPGESVRTVGQERDTALPEASLAADPSSAEDVVADDTSDGWDDPPPPRSQVSAPSTKPSATKPPKESARPARQAGTTPPARKTEPADGRVYRRMPADFVETFRKLGGVTAVAEHYGVPRHTAQGWVRRLRKEGALPDPWRK